MHQHETLLTVPFHDADMMGVTWHGHYIRYMEIARCELLERIGYTYLDMYDSGYAWPVVDLKIRYSKGCTSVILPLCLEDDLWDWSLPTHCPSLRMICKSSQGIVFSQPLRVRRYAAK